ncbi:hypothetical protein E4U43_007270 [Claviceps pusilla]|uniref:Uncharacterized protein n=1 Tax=Claviceps pusilla TaxID=123648 RepID=A0A9P7NJ73_9HYPO|nr:hypothetical protein E4U43_007270 [Claviceps pusilla]
MNAGENLWNLCLYNFQKALLSAGDLKKDARLASSTHKLVDSGRLLSTASPSSPASTAAMQWQGTGRFPICHHFTAHIVHISDLLHVSRNPTALLFSAPLFHNQVLRIIGHPTLLVTMGNQILPFSPDEPRVRRPIMKQFTKPVMRMNSKGAWKYHLRQTSGS